MPADDSAKRKARARWAVHLGLIASATVSLVVEPVLALHVALGLVFIAFVTAHVRQRRQTSAALARQLARPAGWRRPAGRLAISDAALLAVTVVMLASGLWDWLDGHPTRIRWHAVSGFALAGYLAGHTFRRRRRLAKSHVR